MGRRSKTPCQDCPEETPCEDCQKKKLAAQHASTAFRTERSYPPGRPASFAGKANG